MGGCTPQADHPGSMSSVRADKKRFSIRMVQDDALGFDRRDREGDVRSGSLGVTSDDAVVGSETGAATGGGGGGGAVSGEVAVSIPFGAAD